MLSQLFREAKWGSLLLTAAGAISVFGCPQARAQEAATRQQWNGIPPNALLYLDGKPSTLAEIRQLADKDIQSVGGTAVYGADSISQPGSNVMALAANFWVTKANANSPAVLAMADRFDLREGYVEKPAPISMIAPRALAYITGHYPQAWLGGQVMERTQKSTGAVRYHVQLADRWGWRYVDFTAEGEVVEHPLASPVAMLLALTLSYPHAVVATNVRPYALIYVDGQRVSPETVRALKADSLAGVVVLNKDVAPLLAPDAAGLGLLLITTKQGHKQPATVAFNKRMQQLEIIQKLASHSRKTLPATSGPPAPLRLAGDLGEIHYYLDGKRIAPETVEKLNSDTIASVDVVSGEYAPDTAARGVVLLKTKHLPPVASSSSHH